MLHKPFYAGAFSSELRSAASGKGDLNEVLSPREKTIVKLVAEGAQQQGRERDPQSQHQDDGDPSGGRHAQAQRRIRPRAWFDTPFAASSGRRAVRLCQGSTLWEGSNDGMSA